MTVIIPEHSGFCPGVSNAEKNIFRLKKREPGVRLFVYGYLINNRKYIAFLEEQGVRTVESMEDIPEGAVVIVRTHGLDRNEEAALRGRFRVVDLTCPKVKKVQNEIDAHARQGYAVVIVGKEDHPETRGHKSCAGECSVIGRVEECAPVVDRLQAANPGGGLPRKVFLCAQTTASRDLFEAIVSAFQAAGPGIFDLSVYDSICPVTDRKERESLRLRKDADVTFVVGDKISANASKLYRLLSAEPGTPVYFVEDLAELKSLGLDLPPGGKALLIASASTPAFIEQDIALYLESL
ncbi:MAG: 4-hydroxy-3-methylbut-2-enyl diphosphate reductase [Spirochaetales bacterium]|nr:4-hydroxy-3-methylbut-2-enyl diphosphate reductase [Spirochaetales bacterium]